MSGFYDIAVSSIDGTADLLSALRGKVTLAVNVASQCGLTPQYRGLEELQRELAPEGFEVNGPQRHAVYHFLTSAASGIPGDISWNFEKFLIGRDGQVLKRYPPETKPRDNGLLQDIAGAL